MPPTLTPTATTSLHAYVESHTSGPIPKLPGAILHITNAQTHPIFTHASGGGLNLSPTSTLFTTHSVTKVIGAIAFLQLVDGGIISLDDPTLIPRHLPELAAKAVLTGSSTSADGKTTFHFEPRTGDITPRMLLTHTYGGGHSYFNTLLHTYLTTAPEFANVPWTQRNEGADFWSTLKDSPLLWQPGTRANYGQGFDWVAVLMERVTGRSLEDVLGEGIFEKLGLRKTGFEGQYGGSVADVDGSARKATAAEGENTFWPRSLRTPEKQGAFIPIDPPSLPQVLREDAYPTGPHHVHPLGTGLVSSASDLTRILSVLLPQNAGVDPVSGTRILSVDAVREITRPQLSETLRMCSRDVPSAVGVCLPLGLSGEGRDPEGSFGMGCGVQGRTRVMEGGKRGRGRGSVYWFGAANTEFWVDGEKGIVVVVEGNFFPWNDAGWLEFVDGVEARIYEGLEG